MVRRDLKFVLFAQAYNEAQALRLRMLLDRSGVHYMVKNEYVQHLIGLGNFTGNFNPATGPIEFHVPEDEYDRARLAIEDLFEIHYNDIPDVCPACAAANPLRKADCPSCGLFLA